MKAPGPAKDYKNIGKNNFNDASWTVVEANCHFLK